MLQTVAAFDRLGEENAFAVLARATALAAQGRDIVNLGIGQPDFRTPEHIVEAAVKALRDGHHGYTPANGILPLREAVARRTLSTTGVEVSPERVMILPGGKPTMYAAIVMFGEPRHGWRALALGDTARGHGDRGRNGASVSAACSRSRWMPKTRSESMSSA
jgi:aspartate/methionine/tyrosine aminotransferase